MIKVIRHFLAGSFMGIAGMIPGVSSGTIAVITGVYKDMLSSIDHICKRKEKKLPHILYLVNLFTGVVLATYFFAGVMEWLLHHYTTYTQLFFSGLIIGSIPLIYVKAQITDKKIRYALPIVMGFLLVILLGMGQTQSAENEFVFNLSSGIMVFLSGFLVSGASLIPGLSGSMVLLMLGLYSTMIISIKELYFPFLLLLVSGVLMGLIFFSKLISFFIHRYPTITYFMIMGFLLGSVLNLWPGFPDSILLVIFHFLVFIMGFLLTFMCFIWRKEKYD